MAGALLRAWHWVARREPDPSPHAETLAAYAALRARSSEVEREKRRLRKLVDEIPEGEHGGWRKRFGTPAEVTDDEAVAKLLADHGLTVPTKYAAAPLIVEYVGDPHESKEPS